MARKRRRRKPSLRRSKRTLQNRVRLDPNVPTYDYLELMDLDEPGYVDEALDSLSYEGDIAGEIFRSSPVSLFGGMLGKSDTCARDGLSNPSPRSLDLAIQPERSATFSLMRLEECED